MTTHVRLSILIGCLLGSLLSGCSSRDPEAVLKSLPLQAPVSTLNEAGRTPGYAPPNPHLALLIASTISRIFCFASISIDSR